VRLNPDLRKAERLLRDAKEMVSAELPPTLLLNEHCQVCEFRQRCHDQAVQEDNLTLLRGMGEKELRSHNHKGIFTVTQLSYTFRYRKPRKRAKQHEHPHYHSLQARSIRTGTVHVHGRPSLPRGDTRVYLDIEGIPDRDLYYLVGVVVESGESITHYYYWADDEGGQDAAFTQFVELIGSLPNCVVYHYGNYETSALINMRRKLPPHYQDQLDSISKKAVNLLTIVHRHVYFPTYSNSLKDIAKALGHEWAEPEASGLWSVACRETWERNLDPTLKGRIVQYNKDDCLALKLLHDFLSAVEAGQPSAEGHNGKCP
jgi:predicted RecB family nuclease